MAGFQKIYTSQNQYLEDVARSTGLFDDEYYGIAKETGKDAEYLQLIANMKDNVSSSFDRAFYDKLSGEERFNYLATEQYMDKSSDEYKKSQEYFNQRAKQIKNEEIYSGLNGFQKAAHSFAGFLGNAFLQVGGIVEGLVDSALMSMNFLAQSTGIPLIAGKARELDEKTKELIAKDTTGYNAAQSAMNDYINAYTFIDKNFVAQTVNDVAAGLVRMVPMFIPGAGQAGYVAYLASGAGNTAQGVIQENPDINYWQMFAYTAASTGLEALTEWASGKLFGDDLVSSIMKGEKYAPTGNIIKTLAKNSATESLEEFVAELFGGILYNRMIDQTKNVSITDALYAALIGGLTGFLMTGGNVLSTKKLSLYEGKLVDPSTLTVEQRNAAKKIKLGDRWSLTTLINQVSQNQNATDNVTKLMAKYGVSLNDIKTAHNAEYQEALKQDVDTKTQQAKTILDLANVFRTIGEEQFQRATKFLEESLDEAQTLVDNYINHTPKANETAAQTFKALYPNETFTPKAIPSNAEQQLAKSIREIVPNTAVVFGDFGSKEGLAKASINRGGNFIFVKNGLVEEMGYNKVLNDVIKYEIANDLIGQLPVKDADNIAKLALGEEVKYSKLTRDQKLSIAQMICFDQKFNQKTFFGDKETHRKLYNYINNLAERTSKFGRKTEGTKIKYNNLLKVRDRFIKSVADAVANQHDLTIVRKRYNMSEEEFTKKVKDATRVSILNNTIRLTDLDFAEESISRIYAMKELLSNITEDGDFDWTRLYDSTYYKPEFVAMVTQNEADFNLALRLYIAANYNMDLNGIQITTILDSIKNTMSEQDVRKAAETVLTKEFLDSTNDLTTIQTELANKLFYMVQLDVAKTNLIVDSIIITDNQIKGTGKLKLFLGEIDGRKNILRPNGRQQSIENTRDEHRAIPPKGAEYEDTTIENVRCNIQTADTLSGSQKNRVDWVKETYGLNLKYFAGDLFIDGELLPNAMGFVEKTDVYIRYDETITFDLMNKFIEHEATHKRIEAEPEKYEALRDFLRSATEGSVYADLYDKYEKMYSKIYKGNTDLIEEELMVNIIVGIEQPKYHKIDEPKVKSWINGFKKTSTKLLKEKASKDVKFSTTDVDWDAYLEDLLLEELFEEYHSQKKSEPQKTPEPQLTKQERRELVTERLYTSGKLDEYVTRLVNKHPEMKEYFKNTKMSEYGDPWYKKDNKGNTYIVMFHGTDAKFDTFMSYRMGEHGSVKGKGFYFTRNLDYAKDYVGKFDGQLIASLLKIEKPLGYGKLTVTKDEITKFITELDEKYSILNVTERLKKGTRGAISDFVDNLFDTNHDDWDIIRDIMEYSKYVSYDNFYDTLKETIGYDGVIMWHKSEGTQAIVFKSNQIKDVFNFKPTESPNIRMAISDKTTQKQPSVANQILKQFEDGSKKLSEVQYSESNSKEYLQVSYDMIDEMADTFALVNDNNYDEVRKALKNSKKPYAQQALRIFDLYTIEMVGKFNPDIAQKIENNYQKTASGAGQTLALQAQRVAERKPISDTISTLKNDGFNVTVTDEIVQLYDSKLKDKEAYIKELEQQIKDLEKQLQTAKNDIDKAALNKQLKEVSDKKGVIQSGSNSDILDHILTHIDSPEQMTKLQEDMLGRLLNTAIKAQEEGKKVGYYKYDENGQPKPFPKATEKLTKTLKKLKSFRMWSMLSSPVTWVRNWLGNQGMKSLDAMTNFVEGFMTSRSDFDKSQMKFTESRAGNDLYNYIAEQNEKYIMSLVRGEDVKYETSAEKAADIKRRERQIEYESANAFRKACLKAQDMADWGLSTGPLGDEPVVFRSICKNMGNLVANNINFLMQGIQTEANLLSKRTTLTEKEQSRLDILNKAIATKDAKDVFNALSKEETSRLFDVCKERSFQQYFKNPNALSKWFSKFGAKHPVYAELVSWVIPFPKVAANVLSMAYRYSPLSFFKGLSEMSKYKQMQDPDYTGPSTGFEKAQMIRTFSEATVGTFMLIAGAIFSAMGLIDIDDDDYMGPCIKIWDFKVSLSDLAPSMTTFSTASAVVWAWKNDRVGVTDALNVLYENTLLGNVESLLTYGSFTDIAKNVSISYISQYIPSILKLINKGVTGGVKKDKSGNYLQRLVKTLGSYVPGLSQLVPNKIDPYTGHKVYQAGSENWFLNLLASLSPLGIKWDGRSELEKQAALVGAESTGLSGKFTINEIDYDVKDKEKYSKYRANYINEQFNNIVSGKQTVTVEDENGKRITTTYNKLTDKQKKNVINRLYTEATSMTKIKWWTDQGNKYVVTNRDLYNEYRKMFKNIIYKKNWSKSKFVES